MTINEELTWLRTRLSTLNSTLIASFGELNENITTPKERIAIVLCLDTVTSYSISSIKTEIDKSFTFLGKRVSEMENSEKERFLEMIKMRRNIILFTIRYNLAIKEYKGL